VDLSEEPLIESVIAIWPTSNLFKTGHRIRLEISSSNFPHYDRNPNTGRRFGTDSDLAVADQTIYHDPERPSKVVLPVVPSQLRSSDSSEAGGKVRSVR
jgi:putative CocE/NonD family hydrolase